MLWPRLKIRCSGPSYEENLALVQTMFGENSRAISTLTSCYKRPYQSNMYLRQRASHRPFLGSIRSGTRCAAIPLSKNSARKSRNRFTHLTSLRCGKPQMTRIQDH